MTYAILPLTNDPRQVFTADVMLDGGHEKPGSASLPDSGQEFSQITVQGIL